MRLAGHWFHRTIPRLLLTAVIGLGPASCGSPFVKIQEVYFCLVNSHGVLDFKREVAAISEAEHLAPDDGSEKVAAELSAIESPYARNGKDAPPVLIILSDASGFSLLFINIGLADYQMIASFTADADDAGAAARAERIIQRLDARWPTKSTGGSGTWPDPSC